MLWDLVLIFFLLKKVLAGPVNNARDPQFFNQTKECMEKVHSKRTLSLRLDSAIKHASVFVYFLFFWEAHLCGFYAFPLSLVHNLWDPQISFFNKTFIKNESSGIIYIFKNYFAIVFSVFNNKQYPNTPLVCVWLSLKS